MMEFPEGVQLAMSAQWGRRPLFYKLSGTSVMLWSGGRWVTTSFSSLQNVVDLWDEVSGVKSAAVEIRAWSSMDKK